MGVHRIFGCIRRILMEACSISGMLCGIFEGFLGKLHIEFHHTHTQPSQEDEDSTGYSHVRDAVVADADWQGGRLRLGGSVGWVVGWRAR